MGFKGSHLWELRQLVGSRLIVTAAAVSVVLDADDRVFLHERGDTGQWCLPGGSAEPGQTFSEAAAAETSEETGLRVDPAHLTAFASLSDERWTRFTFPNGDEVHSFNLCFVTRDWAGRARPDGEESLRTGFFPADRLPDPMLPMSERVLELYAAWKTSGVFQAS
jgi:8-oxo-dGTP pyrophosphatase MutT (NUDIX family)